MATTRQTSNCSVLVMLHHILSLSPQQLSAPHLPVTHHSSSFPLQAALAFRYARQSSGLREGLALASITSQGTFPPLRNEDSLGLAVAACSCPDGRDA
jgi:hypothetical protein